MPLLPALHSQRVEDVTSRRFFGFLYGRMLQQTGYAPVKVAPPPHPVICGAFVGLYHHTGSSLSLQYVGDSRVLLLLSWGMWGVGSEFVLIQDGGDCSRKDLWVHFGTLERTEVFTSICGIRFIVIQLNTSITPAFSATCISNIFFHLSTYLVTWPISKC